MLLVVSLDLSSHVVARYMAALGLRHDSGNLAGAEEARQNGATDSRTGDEMTARREIKKAPIDIQHALVATD